MATSEEHVFVGSGESGVYVCGFAGGELGEARQVFPLEGASSLEIGPRGKVLYVSTGKVGLAEPVGEVIALRVLEGGKLEELNRVLFDAERFCSLAVSPDRRVLLGASYGSGVVASF
ncbi:MAG: beta-propeller fold lactonase family protein, partial [Verrucomicrobiales bacterium]|nr:beta-propeller fold lactonase family protein [Verrucomicrobiales bacterium]